MYLIISSGCLLPGKPGILRDFYLEKLENFYEILLGLREFFFKFLIMLYIVSNLQFADKPSYEYINYKYISIFLFIY